MAIDTGAPRSRRALLGAAIGAGIATVASALARPLPARADDGDFVVVGQSHVGSSPTEIQNDGGTAIRGWGDYDGIGIWGQSFAGEGVYGSSTHGNGVQGETEAGDGVVGFSSVGVGVHGTSQYGRGVYGESRGAAGSIGHSRGHNTGVIGVSGGPGSSVPPGPPKTGVHGYAIQDADSRGVHGLSTGGRGVYGQATSGYGVRGYAETGTAGYFATKAPNTGTGLQAVGRVRFDNCAGLATIASGHSSVTVSPGIDLSPSSAVVAMLKGSAGGLTTVHRYALNASANTFTIYLTKAATQSVQVAWHVFG